MNFSYADAGRFPLRRLAQTAPTYAGMVGEGLYHVHFVVPAAPSNLSPCGKSGNLRVLVTGPGSADQPTCACSHSPAGRQETLNLIM